MSSIHTLKLVRRILFFVILIVITAFFVYPYIWLITTSFKTGVDAFAMPPKFFFTPTLDNYLKVLRNGDFFQYILNSVIATTVSVAISMVLGVPASYAIAKLRFKNKKRYSLFFLSARVMPPIASVLPMYIIFMNLELLQTRIPIILMYVLMTLPIVIWIMPAFFEDVPSDLRESAFLDGCNERQAFFRIMLPVAKGGLTSTAIYCMIIAWNEFLFALILCNRATQTLPVAVTSFMTFRGTEWGMLSAAGTIIMLPMIVFGILVQKNFARGMSQGALKG